LAGGPVPFRPEAVVLACGRALEACSALRQELGVAVVSDLPAIANWLVGGKYTEQVRSGALVVNVAESAGPAAVRPLDLARALDDVLERILGGDALSGPVRLEARSCGEEVGVSLSWCAVRPNRVEGRVVVECLHSLSSYGARVVFDEIPLDGRFLLEIFLPPAAAAAHAADERKSGASA
jgi:hypothetical protein